MLQACVMAAFIMLAAVLIVAIGPVLGLVAWLLVYGSFLASARALRRYVWDNAIRGPHREKT